MPVNKEFIHSHIHQAISTAKRNREYLAIMHLDVNPFSMMNESEKGSEDLLLQTVMQRFKTIASNSEHIFTLSDNQFVIMIEGIASFYQVTSFIRKYFSAFAYPFTAGRREIEATAAAGVSVFPENGIDSKTLLKNAELAHQHAKKSGKNNFMFFTSSMARPLKEQADILDDIKQALNSKEFT